MSTDPPRDAPPDAPREASGPVVDDAGEGATAGSPYGNLFVPLVVVPAAIVVVLVLVFVLFGAIGGGESSLRQDLDRMLRGGSKQQQHAAYALVQKLSANAQAEEAGRTAPYPVAPEFRPELLAAWNAGGQPPWQRYVLASLLTRIDPQAGVPLLVTLLDLGDAEDEGARIRFDTLLSLAALGDPRALGSIARFLEHPDPGLRLVATVGMQRMPREEALPRVRRGLGDPALDVRITAAVTLAKLGDAEGAELLRDATRTDLYAAEAQAGGRAWSPERIQHSRRTALGALGELRRPVDRELVAALAREADDLLLRDAAKRLLEAW